MATTAIAPNLRLNIKVESKAYCLVSFSSVNINIPENVALDSYPFYEIALCLLKFHQVSFSHCELSLSECLFILPQVYTLLCPLRLSVVDLAEANSKFYFRELIPRILCHRNDFGTHHNTLHAVLVLWSAVDCRRNQLLSRMAHARNSLDWIRWMVSYNRMHLH